MTWFDYSRGCNPKFAVEDYIELKKELNSKANDFEKLKFLKFQYKEFIKSIFYQMGRNRNGLEVHIEKEMLLEIDYLEFMIKSKKTGTSKVHSKKPYLYEIDFKEFSELKKKFPAKPNDDIIYMMVEKDGKRDFAAIRKSVYTGQKESLNKKLPK